MDTSLIVSSISPPIHQRRESTSSTTRRFVPPQIEPHHPQVPQSELGQLLRATLDILEDCAAEATLNHLPYGIVGHHGTCVSIWVPRVLKFICVDWVEMTDVY